MHVLDPGDGYGGSFAGEPTGLIVGLAGTLPRSGVTVQSVQARVWTVAFDAPQHMRDGRGPFERADISEELLVAAPPISEEEDAEEGEAEGGNTEEEADQGVDSAGPDDAPSSDPGTTTPFS